jgi:predicted transcriptional regulator of viral defense system
MSLTQLHARLRTLDMPYFRSKDAAAWLDLSTTQASRVLAQLSSTGHLIKLSRGRWAHPERIRPFMLPQALTAPRLSYVSLYSALYHHEMIEQIPEVVYGVTTERTRRAETPLGPVSLHQVAPRFCCGFDSVAYGINLATPEKALVDTLYLTPARSHLFRALPEFELPRAFKISVARRYLERIDSPSRRTIVAGRLEEICARR